MDSNSSNQVPRNDVRAQVPRFTSLLAWHIQNFSSPWHLGKKIVWEKIWQLIWIKEGKYSTHWWTRESERYLTATKSPLEYVAFFSPALFLFRWLDKSASASPAEALRFLPFPKSSEMVRCKTWAATCAALRLLLLLPSIDWRQRTTKPTQPDSTEFTAFFVLFFLFFFVRSFGPSENSSSLGGRLCSASATTNKGSSKGRRCDVG